jgi:AcrR family transcriptional regulator
MSRFAREPTPSHTRCLDLMSMYVTRQSGRTSASREQILAAVRSLLEEGVFHETTVEEVAQRAHVSRATLYGHFGSRLGLVDAMCESFDANPALVALRETADVDVWLERVVDRGEGPHAALRSGRRRSCGAGPGRAADARPPQRAEGAPSCARPRRPRCPCGASRPHQLRELPRAAPASGQLQAAGRGDAPAAGASASRGGSRRPARLKGGSRAPRRRR